MEVHCDEGIANRIGHEPCVVGREAGGEASAGVRIGQPMSRERINWDADVCHGRKAKHGCASTRAHIRSCVVEDPGIYVRSSTGNRETSTFAAHELRGPHREGDEPKPMMHGDEGSDSAMSHCEASERGPGDRRRSSRSQGRMPTRTRNRTARPGHPAGKARPTAWTACGKPYASPPTSEVAAGCLNWARPVLCGGRSVMSVPTAITLFPLFCSNMRCCPMTRTARIVAPGLPHHMT